MQNSFEKNIRSRVALRNDPEHIRVRLTLRFSLLYFAMFTLGLLLCRYTLVGAWPALRAQTDSLFHSPFADCTLARDYIRAILIFSRREVLLVLGLAAAGMTYFTVAASDAALSAHALLLGCVCYSAIGTVIGGKAPAEYANLAFFLYFFSQLAQTAILLATAAEAVVFSCSYRDASRALRTQRDNLGARYVLRVTSYTGMALTVGAAQAFFTALLEKL